MLSAEEQLHIIKSGTAEIVPEELDKFWKVRTVVQEKLLALGFKRIALDLAGYSRGAVNGQ